MTKSKIIFISLIVFGIAVPILVYAALVPCGRCCQNWNADRTVCNTPCDGVSYEEAQPCTLCDIFRMLQMIMNYIWWFLLIIAPLFIIAGGIMILTAGVKPDQLESGKRIITGTIVGLGIAFLSWTILNMVFLVLAKEQGEQGAFPWPWNRIECTGGTIREQEEEEEEPTGINLNRYCHLQIAREVDRMVYRYDTASECYAECPSYCVNCEAWCCLSTNLNGSNNVCTIAGDSWCSRPARSGSENWILNPPPGGALPEQKGDASIRLTRLLNCMYSRIPSLQINSISDNNLCSNPPTCNPGTGNICAHTVGSCHYGGPVNGPCFGYSYAVDFHTNISCNDIMNAALACQSVADAIAFVLWEDNHTHVSVGTGCRCDESRVSSCGP